MGSDVMPEFGPPHVQGTNFSVSYMTENREQTDEFFAKISEGGTVQMAPADMFWAPTSGRARTSSGLPGSSIASTGQQKRLRELLSRAWRTTRDRAHRPARVRRQC